MKAGFFVILCLGLASAIPHGGKLGKAHKALHHRRSSGHEVVKKDSVVVVTDVVEEDVVYVNGNGKAITTVVQASTVAEAKPQATTSLQPLPVTPSSSSPSKSTETPSPHVDVQATSSKHSTSAVAKPTTSAQKQAPVPKPSAAPSAPSTNSGMPAQGPGFSSAISYSPYTANSGCRSQAEVATDIAQLTNYQVIRLYGVDCNQTENVMAAIQNKPMQIFAGVFNVGDVQGDTKELIRQVNGNWKHINTVSVFNEAVQDATATVPQVVAAISTVRTMLRAAGYQGPVVTVDTEGVMYNNIELCTASDYCAFNCHPFFAPVAASDSGPFVKSWVDKISAKAGGKPSVVTESGWPTAGGNNGVAVPSPQNHDVAIASLKAALPKNLVLFQAFNNLWAPDSASTHGVEKHWGLLGNAPSAS